MFFRRLFGSSSFWIVATYVLFYLFTVLGFLWLLYSILGSEFENNVKANIDRDYFDILASVEGGGAPEMQAHIDRLVRTSDPASNIYILQTPDGEDLSSNYPVSIKLDTGWIHLPKISPDTDIETQDLDNDLTAHVSSSHDEGYIGWVQRGDGYILFVGQSLKQIAAMKTVVLRLAMIVLPLALFLAILGGLVFGQITTRRIEVINQQCRTIRQRGDISLRIPNEKPDDEYGLLIANINAMLDAIDRGIKNVQEVSDDVAHDLRTPLTRIKYSLETGLGHSDASAIELRSIIQSACQETDRVLETFSAILRISQLNTGLRKARFQVFDVAALLSAICEAYDPTADEQGHSLVWDEESAPCLAHGDKDMVAQLMSNLLENCFEHAGPNLTIQAAVTGDAEKVTISIQDNGPGIEPSEHDKIFNKFYRVEKSRSESGSGLGLAIVKAVTELHGGEVYVESTASGTKFVVDLPRGETRGR